MFKKYSIFFLAILCFTGCRDELEDARMIGLRKQEIQSISGQKIKSFTESGSDSRFGTGDSSEIVIVTEDNQEIRITASKHYMKARIGPNNAKD